MRRNFIREKAFDARNSRYKEVELFEYSEEEQEAVRQKRKTRSRASPPKIKSLNDKNSRKHFRWLLFNNFVEGDYLVSLTFDNEHIQMSISERKREFANYIKCLRRLYIKNGLELRYLYVIEGVNDEARFHYHLVVNGETVNLQEMRLSGCGSVANIRTASACNLIEMVLLLPFQSI